MIGKEDFVVWFRQFWSITGASTRQHPAPFPLELAYRLVRMFSFYGDIVLDPFCGTGTTLIAALKTGRNSIGLDIDAEYCRIAANRLISEKHNLSSQVRLLFEKGEISQEGALILRDNAQFYAMKKKRPSR